MAGTAKQGGEDPKDWLLDGSSGSSSEEQLRDCCPNPWRRFCLRVVKTTAFDAFILFIISLNCISMANDSPVVPDHGTPWADFVSKLELTFNIIFTIEMTLKISAYGLRGYLQDSWNLLDVVVVSTAWAPYIFPGLGNYGAIRAVRVLRALRTVNRVPAMRKIIMTLLTSIPQVSYFLGSSQAAAGAACAGASHWHTVCHFCPLPVPYTCSTHVA